MNIVKNIFYMARRFKTATALNLLGLVVAYAAFYLLMTQVIYNRSYNQNIADGERVFRFESKMAPTPRGASTATAPSTGSWPSCRRWRR